MLNTRQVQKSKPEREANRFALHLLSYSSINDIEDFEGALFNHDLTDKDIHNLLIRYSLFESV